MSAMEGMTDSVVTVRIMGKRKEDVLSVAKVLLSHFKDRAIGSPIFPNQREGGFRMYVNVAFKEGRRKDEQL